MQYETLQLGHVLFDLESRPDEIPLGGEQMLSVLQFPGGFKEVQLLGAQERSITWSGVFSYEKAWDNVQALDQMCRQGDVQELWIDNLIYRRAIVKKFQWSYRTKHEIPYEIELELVANFQSILYSDPLSMKDALPWKDMKIYTAVDGDSVWKLALRFYGDGGLYRKIANANNLDNPDQLKPGTKLVIPR
ncbi:LysM peptidoglycan-binding domain-containing protein [Tumebacillus sp. ITR2]|uniref:LysM peptidoglycan-binding domain-containing protein n=1 Tax=Tumebacillus amylolyticus TaxID=2801339 RepID=A0ABS1J7I1_9BACL|nr:LysM peptidoglycan-binding domain-containing protein [Tumebacillus amylolyticus]MBL0386230.1 LysM peptidoglycan-binding domain-containing protein [Tumebacillus amylolyticus]